MKFFPEKALPENITAPVWDVVSRSAEIKSLIGDPYKLVQTARLYFVFIVISLLLASIWGDVPVILGIVVNAVILIGTVYLLLSFLRHMNRAKRIFIEELCRIIGFTYHAHGIFSPDNVTDHRIFPQAKGSARDGLAGTHAHASFEIQEVILKTRDAVSQSKVSQWLGDHGITTASDGGRDSDDNVNWMYVRLKVDKAFAGHTVVVPDRTIIMPFQRNFTGMERVNIVSPVFENLYDIYSTSQIEARVIFDPAFIERLTQAGTSMQYQHGKAANVWDAFLMRRMQVSFKGNEILFIYQLPGKFLNTGWLVTVKPHTVYAALAELDRALRMIEALQFNPTTGPGQKIDPTF